MMKHDFGGKMMYKMVVLDLDGTLLNDKKQVSKRNVEIINKIQKEKDVLFVIATGKNIKDISYIIEMVGEPINQYIIASNGAIIKDNVKNDYLLKRYLGKEQVIKVIDLYKKFHLQGILHTDKGTLTDGKREVETNPNTQLIQELKKHYIENPISTTSMFTLCGEPSDLRKMKEELDINFTDLEATDICHFIMDTGRERYETAYIDVMKKNATKANAIKILADYLQICKEDIVIMGDGANDISMFEMSGYKIAMGNADENLKKKADFITDNNNEDGVAKALEEIFYGIGKGESKILPIP